MANTAPYRCPPPHQFPPAHECTVEDLLDIAARAISGALHELMSSSPHVEAMCRLVEQLSLDLIDAREDLAIARRENANLRLELDAAKKSATITTLMVRVSKTLEQLAHEDDLEQLAEDEHERAVRCNVARTLLERQRAVTRPIAKQSAIEAAYHSQSMLFDVSDTDIVDPSWLEGERTRDIPDACEVFA